MIILITVRQPVTILINCYVIVWNIIACCIRKTSIKLFSMLPFMTYCLTETINTSLTFWTSWIVESNHTVIDYTLVKFSFCTIIVIISKICTCSSICEIC